MALKHFTCLFLAGLFICSAAFAKPYGNCKSDCSRCHILSPVEAQSILKDLGEVKDVRNSSVKGLWEVTLEKDGRRAVAFMDFSKKKIIAGRLFSVETWEPVTGTAPAPAPAPDKPASINIASIPVANSIVMGNPQGSRKIFVFTDPDCPFCQKMHTELMALEKSNPDLAIYVLLNPQPFHPKSYDKSRRILAEKSRALLDKAFRGEEIIVRPGAPEGRNELDEIIHFARHNGFMATPTMVLDDGAVVTGFRDAESIKKLLNGKMAPAEQK